jgi:CBS domain-containing protein
MIAVGVRHLPVVEEGEVIGIVSMRDLVAPFID